MHSFIRPWCRWLDSGVARETRYADRPRDGTMTLALLIGVFCVRVGMVANFTHVVLIGCRGSSYKGRCHR